MTLEEALARIAELEAECCKLYALEGAGVDNWDGYDAAMEQLEEEDKRQRVRDECIGRHGG